MKKIKKTSINQKLYKVKQARKREDFVTISYLKISSWFEHIFINPPLFVNWLIIAVGCYSVVVLLLSLHATWMLALHLCCTIKDTKRRCSYCADNLLKYQRACGQRKKRKCKLGKKNRYCFNLLWNSNLKVNDLIW